MWSFARYTEQKTPQSITWGVVLQKGDTERTFRCPPVSRSLEYSPHARDNAFTLCDDWMDAMLYTLNKETK